MSDPPDDGEGGGGDVPDAVLEWLSSAAAERGLSETELLRSLLAGDVEADVGAGGSVDAELERVEREFRELVEDVRDRVIQVKREADGKAPADHDHHDLRTSVERLGREVGSLESEVERLDERLAAGFDNYEEILTYLTETTDRLDRKLGRLAGAVIDLRDRVGEAARDEVRRTALAHLTDTANRHGVEKARCDECGEAVHVGMLVEPECPHCDSSFSALEPKKGFFRSSVLHTGTMPALESAPGEAKAEADSLEAMVDDAEAGGEAAPAFGLDAVTPEAAAPTEAESAPAPDAGAEPAPDDWSAASEPAPDDESAATGPAPDDGSAASEAATADGSGSRTDGQRDLEAVKGVGPAYAGRLAEAGVEDLLALAVADPEQLGEAIDVPAATVADWVEQADAMTGS